jgi:hypothetical protein
MSERFYHRMGVERMVERHTPFADFLEHRFVTEVRLQVSVVVIL